MSETNPYAVMSKVICLMKQNPGRSYCLQTLAKACSMQNEAFARLFKDWAGASPEALQVFLSKDYALALLQQKQQQLDTFQAATVKTSAQVLPMPIEWVLWEKFKNTIKDLQIHFGVASSPLGLVFIAWTELGICYWAFIQDNERQCEAELKQGWPRATLLRDDAGADRWLEVIFNQKSPQEPLKLLVKGSPFQLRVWQALVQVRSGELISYSQLAQLAASPKAARAVGTAMADNDISYLIPCHRVIQSSGEIGQYRWGVTRKIALQVWEACHLAALV